MFFLTFTAELQIWRLMRGRRIYENAGRIAHLTLYGHLQDGFRDQKVPGSNPGAPIL
jgi:hypothetical protein